MSATTTTENPRPRKFPPPCWTQEEALALIEAYKDRWYALRRGYLRTADWEAVAGTVAQRCPDASPAKTSAQCRHKMEKLRQRYRAEKQRALSFPGKFFSSWFFYDNMDFMENPNGSSPTVGSTQEIGDQGNSGNGFGFKTLIDQSSMKLGSNLKNNKKNDGDSNPGFGFRVKSCGRLNGKASPDFGPRALNGYPSYMDVGDDKDLDDGMDFGTGFPVKGPVDPNLVTVGFKAKKFGKMYGNLRDFDHDGGETADVGPGFLVENPIDQDSVTPGFRAKKFGKIGRKLKTDYECDGGELNGGDEDGGFWVKIRSDKNTVPAGFRGKYSGRYDGNSNPNLDSNNINGFYSSSRVGFGETSSRKGNKRGRDPVEEIVSSIKFLGEGFMKMEKMKMDMARDIEKMRMEMEMKRNELILESQKQIVDAFVKGLFENKKKVTTTVAPES
ncbi:unnamed protein product [Ilex paraguariensis]|uniref:Myb-like domain-containing protein n=1 Tax=Ilex paraguariensis TaxID=185542 RepID=A0ABC8U0S6_9AQUA